MSYKITTQQWASIKEAEELRKFLDQYAIKTSSVSVVQIGKDGKRTRDNAAERTISDVGTAGFLGGGMGAGIAAAGLMPVAPVLAILAAIALPFQIGNIHKLNKRLPADPHAQYTEITFGFSNVSSKRIGWAEYNLARWVTSRHPDWKLDGITTAKGRAGFTATHDPRPWKDGPQQPRHRKSDKRRGFLGWLG